MIAELETGSGHSDGTAVNQTRQKLAEKLIIENSKHEALEEQYFWPAVLTARKTDGLRDLRRKAGAGHRHSAPGPAAENPGRCGAEAVRSRREGGR